MAKETIQSIKEAELKAEQIGRDAHRESEELIHNAIKEGQTIVSNMEKETKLQSKKELEAANNQGKRLMKEVLEKTEKEIVLLKELAKGKEKEAIQLVIS